MALFPIDGIWRYASEHLPVTVLIDVRRHCYHIRDNTLMMIWADGLPEQGYLSLLRTLTCTMNINNGTDLLAAMAPSSLVDACQRQFSLLFLPETSSRGKLGSALRIEVVFGAGSRGEVFEVRISQYGDKPPL